MCEKTKTTIATKKNFLTPFYGWGSTASKLEPLRGGSLIPRNLWYSLDRPRKDERLSRYWSLPVVLNIGLLDWEYSALTTRPTTLNPSRHLFAKFYIDFPRKIFQKPFFEVFITFFQAFRQINLFRIFPLSFSQLQNIKPIPLPLSVVMSSKLWKWLISNWVKCCLMNGQKSKKSRKCQKSCKS